MATPPTARGETESDVALLVLPAPSFESLMSGCSDFRDFVFHLFAQRIAELMELIEEVAFHRLDQRLAKLLLVRGEGSSTRDEIHTTHQALADELGSVREIVSRLLKGFATQGLIALERSASRCATGKDCRRSPSTARIEACDPGYIRCRRTALDQPPSS